MFDSISFCIGDKTIEVNGQRLDLGRITADVLNIEKTVYADLRHLLERAIHWQDQYEKTNQLSDWYEANELYIQLDSGMQKLPLYRVLKDDDEILEEARAFTQQLSFDEDADCELSEQDLEIIQQRAAYREYLEHPENFGGEDTVALRSTATGKIIEVKRPQPAVPPEPPEPTRALLIFPGNTKQKWERYKAYCGNYARALYDIEAFHDTIANFLHFYLSNLENLNADNYCAALMDFLNNPRSYKLIANPFLGNGLYTAYDMVRLRHIPRETEEGSGVYRIFEYYEVGSLQALLKMDFYKALECGYQIRRCEYCSRFFLQKKGYHTKYCDLPNPENPRYTCAQLGYHWGGIKEAAGDNPKAQSLRRCKNRIDKDYNRAIISEDERKQLIQKAKDLYYEARSTPGISDEAFETAVQSENLYPLCGVERFTRKRGRPKKQ